MQEWIMLACRLDRIGQLLAARSGWPILIVAEGEAGVARQGAELERLRG
jgi:hypothetical protein